ncbi:ABC transporter ATP-binding protein [Oceanobacillus sp. FSL W7-1293]|uniref:ABC transporter ATP-binding protein n=1 Tax=Oceanobacillus sp. FSL W7-1293 TaxID=2921699 RepID=UPI0030D39966
MKQPIIQFENVTFKYRSQQEPTLKNIDLTIHQGEKILIVGPSGSGKSTLAHCLNGLVPFSYKGEMTGSLKIQRQETKELDIFSLSKMVGTVLQDPDGQFIGLSVGEDIAFSLENNVTPHDTMMKRVAEVSRLVDMEEYLEASIHALSGGQKQRVSLAGVMVDDVDILLFDEPLANLDPATGKHAIDLIDQIQKETNTTVVIIEHRLEDVLYRNVDRIIVVNDGEIVYDCSPNVLLASDVLQRNNIREPLYIKALKYADCSLTPQHGLEHLNTLQTEAFKDKLLQWFEQTPPAKKRTLTQPVLQLEDVSFTYSGKENNIKKISFSIDKGEMVSIVGKNGAGKSTLSKLICGFEKNNQGKILYHQKDITGDTIYQRAERIGMVMQNPNQMISKHMIYDEVALGLIMKGIYSEEEIREKVEKTLKICGLYPFRNWPISALSFGQKKRATIASILVLEPEIIILDEPTAGQDFYHYTEMMEFLADLNAQGITIMMITHDMHLMLEYTQRAIVIADGKVIADDSPINILTNEAIVAEANLKETSLFDLAVLTGIEEPVEFVSRFIAFDREVRKAWP